MPRFCTSCGAQLLDSAQLCPLCGSAALSATLPDSPADGGGQEPESSIAGDGAGPAAPAPNPAGGSNAANPAGETGGRFHVSIAHAIAAGGALLGVLAGVGVTVIDYPLRPGVEAGHTLAWGPARSVAQTSALPAPSAVPIAPAASAATPPVAARPAPVAVDCPKVEVCPAPVANRRKEARRAKPVVASAAGRLPAVAVKPLSIDDRYKHIVKQECRSSLLGLICRETVRWRLCNGRWNDGDNPRETRCYVRGKGGEPDRSNGAQLFPGLA